jgi:alcohol dehydrogenase class IV
MIIHNFMFDVNIVIGIGNSSAISTSKIIKITAVKKNRDEKGNSAEFFGSNPHSNGDLFSRSLLIIFF